MDHLNLPGVRTDSVNGLCHGTKVFHATVTEQPKCCPRKRCQFPELYAFGTRKIRYIDLPMHGEHTLIDLSRQRYRCKKCEHTFMPELEAFDPQWRLTKRAVAWIEEQATRRQFTALAQELGIVEKAIRNVFWRYAHHREKEVEPTAGKVLGIDELYLLSKFRCIITNLTDRTVIDLLAERDQRRVVRYLKNLDGINNVERVCMDMWRPYREAVRIVLPDVPVTVDKFHVLKQANHVMEDIRKETQRKLPAGQKLDLMRSRHILLRREADLEPKELKRIKVWKRVYPALIDAWQLKEQFFRIYDEKTPEAAREAFKRWRVDLPLTCHGQFQELTNMVQNWETEIFNYFDQRITNAYTECANGLAKVLNRQGRGHSFDVIRYKLLFQHKKQRFVQLSVKSKLANLGIPFSTFDETPEDFV